MNLLTLVLSATLLVGSNLNGEKKPGGDKTEEERTLNAYRALTALNIDGLLDEEGWQLAPAASDFKQFEPVEGAAPSQRTEVRVLYGTNALYIGVHLFDDEPEAILRTLGRRDEFNKADWFIVSIDSYFDRKTAYTFGINAAGVQMDGITTRNLDRSWDAVWDAAVRMTVDGWVVEMGIPYSMLRFSTSGLQTWGINFRRVIPRLSETDEWALVRRAERGSGEVAQYGRLQGLQDLSPRRNIQVTPYSVSRLQTEEGDPGRLHSDREIDFGSDFKIGLSSNITLDATINPDFGQVESDPAELNLTAFESFFPERRPFFVEGAQIFDFSYGREGSLLYTRRIGSAAPIIGASKLSGRTENGLSFGVLGAATGTNFDPSRLYGIARLDQQLGQYSSVGGMLTTYDRRGEGDTGLFSVTGGADMDLRTGSNRYRMDGHFSFTRRVERGDDAENGFAYALGIDKLRGQWTFNAGVDIFDDRFNPNDLGRLRRNNSIRMNAGFGHQLNGGRPVGPFRRATLRLFSWQNLSYRKRINQGSGFFLSSNLETKGYQDLDITMFVDYLFGGYDLFETRGLRPWAAPREMNLRASMKSDSRRSWRLEPNTRLTYAEDGSANYALGLETEWNAGSRLNLSTQVGYALGVNQTAWSSNESFAHLDGGWAIGTESTSPDDLDDAQYLPFDGGGRLDELLTAATPFEGTDRYFLPIMGKRDTRTLEFSVRGNVTFSPRLSLQLYSQLFVARGQFDHFSLLLDRDTLLPFDTYPKRDAFAFNSFQTNLVLRWEYRPGSTLYLVWSQARSGSSDLDPFDLQAASPFDQRNLDQISNTFDVFPTNVFLIKLNYLFLR